MVQVLIRINKTNLAYRLISDNYKVWNMQNFLDRLLANFGIFLILGK